MVTSKESTEKESLRGALITFEVSTKNDTDKKGLSQDQKENVLLKKVLTSIANALKRDSAKKAASVETIWAIINAQKDHLATYLVTALEHASLTSDLVDFFSSCFAETTSEIATGLTECVYEAIETTCGLRTSTQGFLTTDFVINSMSLASSLKNLAAAKADPKQFINLIKDVLI